MIYDNTGYRRPSKNVFVHGLYGSIISNENGFFTNDPSSYLDSIGLLHGHRLLKLFLGAPLVLDDKIKGSLAVANREGGYNCEQQKDLELSRQRLCRLFIEKGWKMSVNWQKKHCVFLRKNLPRLSQTIQPPARLPVSKVGVFWT